MKNKVAIKGISVALILLIWLAQNSFAQTSVIPRTCATMEQDSINRAKYPQRGTLVDFEYDLQLKIQELEARNKGKRTQAT